MIVVLRVIRLFLLRMFALCIFSVKTTKPAHLKG